MNNNTNVRGEMNERSVSTKKIKIQLCKRDKY